jgi:hypothetical protein
VTDANIMEVFKEVKVLRITNLALDPTTKLELLRLYAQCYGHNNVTKNELFLWFVKGYIAQEKGIDINWAKVATSTAKEKLRKEEIVKWKLVHGVASKSCNEVAQRV